MCRLRSIRETAEFFKEMDPDTQLTEKTIRTMIAEGTIQHLKPEQSTLSISIYYWTCLDHHITL